MQLHFILKNGKHRGKKLPIRTSPFIIGRSREGHLRLGGDRVSRRHCVIHQYSDRAVIADLGSRNGTIVNRTKLAKGEDRMLWHGDDVTIGDWQLIVSLMDDAGISPIVAPPSRGNELLNELDEFSSALEAGHTTWHQLGSLDPSEGFGGDSTGEKTDQSLEDSAAGPDTTIGMSQKKTEVEKSPPASDSKATSDSKSESESKSDSDSEETKTGHMRIPEHLRPSGPADSQDAADQALKRLFGG